MSQSPSETLKKILESFPDLPRLSWVPQHIKIEKIDQSTLYTSRFGGNQPFRPDTFKWPICEECNAHKAFVCQINLETLPVLLQESIKRWSGLFQLYYCLECMPLDCFKDLVFIKKSEFIPSLKSLAANVVVHKTKFDKKSLPRTLLEHVEDYTENVPSYKLLGDEDEIEMNLVTDWKQNPLPDVPNIWEASEYFGARIKQRLGLTDEQIDQAFSDLENLERLDDDYGEQVTPPAPGVKLGGYVNWCQGVEYPQCPDCSVPMTTRFLQLEEDQVHRFSWGDCGTGHVTLCPQCGRPGLSWACG